MEGYLFTGKMKVTINFDGGCKYNPGPAACAYRIMTPEETITGGCFLKESTNNKAEWAGLLYSLKRLRSMFDLKDIELTIWSDSELVVNQLLKRYRVKNQELKKIYDEVCEILSLTKEYKIFHIRREENKEAHKLVEKVFKENGF